jgi:hypothetical protein
MDESRRSFASHAEAIDLWPSLVVLAADLTLPLSTVRSWRERNSIPSAHWSAVVIAAKARRLRVTAEALQAIEAARDRERRAQKNRNAQSARDVTPHVGPAQENDAPTGARKQSTTEAWG